MRKVDTGRTDAQRWDSACYRSLGFGRYAAKGAHQNEFHQHDLVPELWRLPAARWSMYYAYPTLPQGLSDADYETVWRRAFFVASIGFMIIWY